ncbi:MAG: HDIG domain-containing metalloprotein [Myxococcota bacterium]|jgi:hypothetical protein
MQSNESDLKSRPPQKSIEAMRKSMRDRYAMVGSFMLVMVAMVATLLLSPSIHKLDLPVSESDLGKVATANIRADRDYAIVDEEATGLAQKDAVRQVRAVYFHDMDVGDSIAARVREAFSLMRSVITTVPQKGTQKKAASQNAGQDIRAAKQPKTAQKASVYRQKVGDAAIEKFAAHRDEFVRTLQTVVDDSEFDALARYGFSREAEDGLLQLIQPVMQDMVVSSKELLAAERSQGITVQRIYAKEQVAEGTIASVGAVKDLDEARRAIDRKAEFILADLPRDERTAINGLARELVVTNLRFDKAETERRREETKGRVLPVTVGIKKGQMIVRDGDKLEKRHLMIFRGMREATSDHRDLLVSAGIFIFSLLIILVPYGFARSFVRKFAPRPRDIVFMQLLLISMLLMGKLFTIIGGAIGEQIRHIPMRTFMFLIPFPAGAMMCRFVLNSESALLFTLVMSLFAGMCLDGNLWFTGYTMIGSIVAAYGVAQATQRTTVLKAGLLAGLANVAAALSITLFYADASGSEVGIAVCFALANGIMSAMIVTAFTPAVEGMFGYITDVKLLELANLNHPLLKELIVQAPGTYHHSIVVGSLVEAAAESIHANPLLARVTAYYHDIGKVKNPQYFGENQKDSVNRHDKLKPSMSALVIKTHVKDGIEIAKQHRLGQPIMEIIGQHHGTAIIKFFYLKAKSLAGPDEIVEERDYRYPGPKPQTREAALVMLADAVEAAAKSVPDLDGARLRGLVQKIINNFFRDEQLSECDLTLKDLHLIAAAFIRVLEGIYHQRPEYQESATKGGDEKSRPQHENAGHGKERQTKSMPPQPARDAGGEDGEDDSEDFKRLGL